MEKKKTVIYSIVALVALALLVVGATYAYFQNQYGSASNANVKVTTYTTDMLTFETGSNISITAGQDDFASGKGNKTGQTFTRATLQANNKTNTATANYYMYLNIETNTFTYTNTGTPELLLQVVDKTSGNPVTSITGLDYVTVTDGKNTKWKTMIADTTWYVGGMTSTNGAFSNAKTAYNYEVRANKDATTTVNAKIGLMYVSEYYYGATPDYWTLPGTDQNGHLNEAQTGWIGEDYSKTYNDNWMSTGLTEWTVSRHSGDSGRAFGVYAYGNVIGDGDGNSHGYVLHPSFSLSSSIKFTSGEGTAVNPIRINL